MSRTPNKIPVYHFFFFPCNPYILFCSHLFNYNKHFFANAAQIKWNFFQHHFIRLQLAHIQYIVEHFQQQMRSHFNFFSIFCLFLYIVSIMISYFDHAANSINRRPDIMTHPLEKFSLSTISCLCFLCSYQKFCFIFFILFLFLLPVFLIGSVYPEPEYTKHQKIKKNNTCYT